MLPYKYINKINLSDHPSVTINYQLFVIKLPWCSQVPMALLAIPQLSIYPDPLQMDCRYFYKF